MTNEDSPMSALSEVVVFILSVIPLTTSAFQLPPTAAREKRIIRAMQDLLGHRGGGTVLPPGGEHAEQTLRRARVSCRDRKEPTMEVLYECCGGLDVHAKTVVACL